jgi:hypothetical protein
MATSAQTTPTPTPAPRDEADIGGWAAFAAVVLFVSGMFSGLYGLAAVLNDKVVTVGGGGGVIVWDFTTWGWIHMGVAAVMIATSLGLFAGQSWARWTAVVLCMLNAILQITIITAFPIWALIVIALDMTVVYQLTERWKGVDSDFRRGTA